MKQPDDLNKVLIPIIRKIVPKAIAEDLVGVQPMGPPSKEEMDEMRAERAEIFDRWCWETGSAEDWEKFQQLDKKIKTFESMTVEFDSPMYYAPFTPFENDDDD